MNCISSKDYVTVSCIHFGLYRVGFAHLVFGSGRSSLGLFFRFGLDWFIYIFV